MDKEKLSVVSAIALNSIFGNDPRFSHNIIDAMGSTEAVFSLSEEEQRRVFGPFSCFSGRINSRALEQAEKEYERLRGQGVQFVDIFDPHYPAVLRECPDAPLLLYIRSNTPVRKLFNSRPLISVVGTRDLSLYGKEWCTRIIKEIAATGASPCIVSGLALGVDITAHMAALAFGLPTIGVSPVGIDSIYPARHRTAAEKIIAREGGAIITDYPPSTTPYPGNFLRRNRIIAGLSSATILIESKAKGGGMMTARLASGYGRDVLVLPGRIDDVRSQGCNALVREKIAEPISSLDALPEMLGLKSGTQGRRIAFEDAVRRRLTSCDDTLKEKLVRIAVTVKKNRGIDYDGICSECDMDYSDVAYCAGLLESEGIITADILQRCCINAKF